MEFPKDRAYYEPPDKDRIYYRNVTSGQLGWFVRRDGKDRIRFDRPDQEITVPFTKAQWVAEQEHRPLTKAQITQVAFEADKMLCRILGLHDKADKEWLNLKDETRIAWMETGPTRPVERSHLYRAIMKELIPLAK